MASCGAGAEPVGALGGFSPLALSMQKETNIDLGAGSGESLVRALAERTSKNHYNYIQCSEICSLRNEKLHTEN